MIATKLHIPSSGVNLVHRPKLLEKLNKGLHRKLIFISAPAGFGKTTVLSDWIEQTKIPTAWYSLDKRDNDPTEFLTYIIAGIRNIKNGFGEGSKKLLNAPVKPNIESIVGLLINDAIKVEEDFILVFDDFHLINSQEIFDTVKFLLEHMPGQMHIVISTRSDPPLPIARLRSQNQLLEIRLSDLSFSANDISIFFNKKLKIGLSIDDIYALESKTEGWIAGLQLTALSMRGRDDVSEFINAFAGDNRYIMDYLIEEVLNMQAENVKDFLLRTSLLEQFSGPLCNAVLNISNSQSIMEYLDKNNMFIVPLDNERYCYRYHHLFADLLKQRLFLENKHGIRELHNKASLWFEENEKFAFAIDHALEAENFDKAMHLLKGIVEKLWENGQHTTIVKYGDMLPAGIIQTEPHFIVFYVWVLISKGSLVKAEGLLKLAKTHLNSERKKNGKLLGKIAVTFAYLYSSSGQHKKIYDNFKTSQQFLTESDLVWYSWSWLALGVAHASSGDLKESSKALNKAFEYGIKAKNLYLMSTAITRLSYSELRQGNFNFAYNKCQELFKHINNLHADIITKSDWSYAGIFTILAYIEYMWNKTDSAIENAKTGYELSKKGTDITNQTFCALVYEHILFFKGDHIKSSEILDSLNENLNEKAVFKRLQYSLTGSILKANIIQNKLGKAEELINELGLNINEDIHYLTVMANMSYARFLILKGEYSNAQLILLKLKNTAKSNYMLEDLVETSILCTILFLKTGNSAAAKKSLIEAISLAEKENLFMFFVEEEADIFSLLVEIYRSIPSRLTDIQKLFVKTVLSIIKKRRSQNSLLEVLSNRELDVLKLISDNMTNQEIAESLFISLNTVKTHVKNIHLKLDVASRANAVVKGKEFGFI